MMASLIAGAMGKSGSAAVSGITSAGTDAQRRLKARDWSRGMSIAWFSNMDKDWTINLNTSFEKYQKFCSNFSQIKWKYVRKREEGRVTRDE
jgi:hypothetical protein